MANTILLLSLCIALNIVFLALPSKALSSCNDPCRTSNDCDRQLICINGKCDDNPKSGIHTCPIPVPPPDRTCRPNGVVYCKDVKYPTYKCSPLVTPPATKAKLTLKDFSKDDDERAPSKCDGKYHSKKERVVALSTGWYDEGSRCGKEIVISAGRYGKSVKAKVVDECDSMHGYNCDKKHGGKPPCGNNVVDGSYAVWEALGLDKDLGVVDVTWSMA